MKNRVSGSISLFDLGAFACFDTAAAQGLSPSDRGADRHVDKNSGGMRGASRFNGALRCKDRCSPVLRGKEALDRIKAANPPVSLRKPALIMSWRAWRFR